MRHGILVEFRNRLWFNSEKATGWTLDMLRDLDLTHVMVDGPQGLESSVPAVAEVTTPHLAIVRLHGRRAATWEAAKRMHEALGISRGIVVQTTTYGADHRVVLDGLAALGPGYKGCANALVFESASDADLERLHAAGVRGARFSFRQALGAVLSREAFDRAVGKLRELGWYMKIQPEQNGIVDSVSWFEHLDLPILIDHMGRPDASLGPDRASSEVTS